MDEALVIATQYEHLHARNLVDVNTMSYKHNRHNQGSSTGSRRFIPTVTPRTDKPNCSYCHKLGHTFNDCYSRQKASKSQNSESSFSDPYSRSSAPPYNSVAPKPQPRRAPGPQVRKGPRGMNTLLTSNSSQLLRVHGTVSHIPNLLCTLDTASAISMMTVSTARQHGFAIFPSDITIKSANNAVTPVVGVTDELQIDIHGHSCSISFIVLDHDDHELLLGLDWLRLTGASLHPRDLVLKFPGTSVPLIHNPFDEDIDDLEAQVLSSGVDDKMILTSTSTRAKIKVSLWSLQFLSQNLNKQVLMP
jgi:hypothetical protein